MRRLICVLLGSLIASLSGQIPGVIPQPMSHVIGQNCDYSQAVFLVKNAPNGAFYLQEYAQNQHFLGFDFHATSFRIDPQAQKGKAVLEFERFAPQDLWYGQKEAYALRFEPRRIRIQYNEPQGAMYAFSTLLQALHSHPEGLPYQSIVDQPQFAYRGMHLDVCRHFFDTAFIMRYLDLMALYKMNTFHWHLTEDQAWRLEIKAYPRLTEIGAQRNSTQYGPYRDQTFDSLPYGGYYSQDQVRRLVQYAALRGITVIPEIELPGHSSAALAAYPHLGCTGGPYEVQAGWGVFDDVYCAGKDSTFIFLQTVMDEVCALFPSGYVHIGGDECPKTRWKECPHCRARMNQEGLADEHELQSYFIRRMEKHLNQKGKTIIGWDEILEGGLAPNATVMSWRGVSGGVAAAQQSHSVIMTPGKPCYFDHYQSRSPGEPLAIGGYNPVDSVYAYNPIPTGLSKPQEAFILGAQGNVWTEYMSSEAQVEYMVLPRLPALAEALWTPAENKNFMAFKATAQQHQELWTNRHLNFAKHLFQPQP